MFSFGECRQHKFSDSMYGKVTSKQKLPYAFYTLRYGNRAAKQFTLDLFTIVEKVLHQHFKNSFAFRFGEPITTKESLHGVIFYKI
jgi:hypothetical protein